MSTNRTNPTVNTILSVSRGCVTACIPTAFCYEAVREVLIGPLKLLGEVTRISGNIVDIEMYSTSGVKIGDSVVATGESICVELGPGIMGSISDGLLRPLQSIDAVLPKNISTRLDRTKKWTFVPNKEVVIGQALVGGDIIGTVKETELVTHKILLSPKAKGKVTWIIPEGMYTIDENVITLDDNGMSTSHTMIQKWPIRKPRPVYEKNAVTVPLHTGYRSFDAYCPLAKGGKHVLYPYRPFAKSAFFYMLLSKGDADVYVHIYCNEKGHRTTEGLMEIPETHVSIGANHQRGSVSCSERTSVIVAPQGTQESVCKASVYTGITVAEYYRDQGLNVVVSAEGISMWSTLVSGGTKGQSDTALTSALTSAFDRAGCVTCIGSDCRSGSLTFIGSFDTPETYAASKAFTPSAMYLLQSRIGLPILSIDKSCNAYEDALESYFESVDIEFTTLKESLVNICHQKLKLESVIRTIGKDNLKDEEKLVLHIFDIFTSDFLEQNIFSTYDRWCPLYKTVWMMRNILAYYEQAKEVLTRGEKDWESIKEATKDLLHEISSQKFESN